MEAIDPCHEGDADEPGASVERAYPEIPVLESVRRVRAPAELAAQFRADQGCGGDVVTSAQPVGVEGCGRIPTTSPSVN